MSNLTDTQLVLLSNAAQREDGALIRPEKFHPPALGRAVKLLLAKGFVINGPVSGTRPPWDRNDEGDPFALFITPSGLEAIGVTTASNPQAVEKKLEPAVASGSPVSDLGATPAKISKAKRGRASAALHDKRYNGVGSSPSTAGTLPVETSRNRANSKMSIVVSMLRTPEGVSIGDIMKATDWQAHSVRGAIAGAIKKKLGLSVISERRGDERFYRIAE
jgi:hypothetical protein